MSPTGIWRFEATVNGKTVSNNFSLSDLVVPCSYTLDASSASLSSSLAYGSVNVTSNSICAWAATSNASWIQITSGATYSGSRSVSYSVSANTTASPRTGTLTIAGQNFTVTQAGLVNSYGLFLNKAGGGTVTSNPAGISCGSLCSASFTSGTSVTLTAAPGSGNSFSGWSGACSGTASTCTVTMSSAMNVTASFSINGSTLLTRYRLYHDGTKEHLYTTDTNEYSVLATRGWLAEGAIYQLYPGAGSLNGVVAVPFYRLYNRVSLQHHWTTDANEYNVLGQGDWLREGIDGYILPSSAAGSMPVYRLYLNAFGGLHLWTTDLNEKTVLSTRGWVYEGVAGYVVPLQ
jgi:hypothetical protein